MALSNLEKSIARFVAANLPSSPSEWCAQFPKGKGKIVHDALWGTFELYPHEVALLDTPLLQRLRFIRQTGAVYLTYPSAVHTRFEHTLGVLCQAGRMCAAFQRQPNEQRINRDVERLVRISALVHDTGHGPFSHTSEQFFSAMPDMSPGILAGNGAGEFLSSAIIRSAPFRAFIGALNSHFQLHFDCDLIARIITGTVGPESLYLSEIVHGPFDADKLDYMHRDGLFSGLKLHVDLDRLLASIAITTEGDMTRLVGSLTGTTPLTQIMFNKMLLFTGIYHHHKVRAVDCMLWAIFELAAERGVKIGGRTIRGTPDFLYLTDDLVLAPALTNDPDIRSIIRAVRQRRLWKRALVIARRTVPSEMHENAGPTKSSLFPGFMKLAGNAPHKIRLRRSLAREIWEKADKPCEKHEVWLDVPTLPSMDESKQMWIKPPGGVPPETLGEFIPISQWVELYGSHKWQAHVFCPAAVRHVIAVAAERVLEERFGLAFLPTARQYAGVD